MLRTALLVLWNWLGWSHKVSHHGQTGLICWFYKGLGPSQLVEHQLDQFKPAKTSSSWLHPCCFFCYIRNPLHTQTVSFFLSPSLCLSNQQAVSDPFLKVSRWRKSIYTLPFLTEEQVTPCSRGEAVCCIIFLLLSHTHTHTQRWSGQGHCFCSNLLHSLTFRVFVCSICL